jgi:hypothetical protein
LVFFVAFFTAINSPFALLRLVYALAPASLAFTCVRFFTAPLRALSPVGLFVATASSQKAPHQGGAGKASDFPKAGTIRKCCALGFVPPTSRRMGVRMLLNRPWTEEDDQKLLALADAGRSSLSIAAAIKRSKGAVQSRLTILRHRKNDEQNRATEIAAT